MNTTARLLAPGFLTEPADSAGALKNPCPLPVRLLQIEMTQLLADNQSPSFIIDAEGNWIGENAAAAIFVRDDMCQQLILSVSRQVMTQKVAAQVDVMTTSSPRRQFVAHVVPLRDDIPGQTLVWWTLVETTMKDQLILALKASRILYRDLAEAAGDFCIEVDSEGFFGFISPGGALGYVPWRLNGQPISCWGPNASILVSRTRLGPIDVDVIDSEARHRCLSCVAAPIFEGSQWLGTRVIARDVTLDRQATKALVAAQERERLQLAILAAARGQLDGPSMLSHALNEIRTHFIADQCMLTNSGILASVDPIVVDAHVLATPCQALGEDFGQLQIVSSKHAWRDSDAKMLASISDTVAIIAAQARHVMALQRWSLTDALTGLSNRRAFEHEMTRSLANLDRIGGEGALLLIDIDHFKAINDNFGHPAGDKLLAAVAKLLGKHLREGDLPARFGGDEFAIWLSNAGLEGAARIAQLLHEGITFVRNEVLAAYEQDASLPLSLSIGISAYKPKTVDTETLFGQADIALYAAKRQGRARTILWSPQLAIEKA